MHDESYELGAQATGETIFTPSQSAADLAAIEANKPTSFSVPATPQVLAPEPTPEPGPQPDVLNEARAIIDRARQRLDRNGYSVEQIDEALLHFGPQEILERRHRLEAGIVGETGDHGELGANALLD